MTSDSQRQGEREVAERVRNALNAAAQALGKMHPELTIVLIVTGPHGTVSLATVGIDDPRELGDALADVAAGYNARRADGSLDVRTGDEATP